MVRKRNTVTFDMLNKYYFWNREVANEAKNSISNQKRIVNLNGNNKNITRFTKALSYSTIINIWTDVFPGLTRIFWILQYLSRKRSVRHEIFLTTQYKHYMYSMVPQNVWVTIPSWMCSLQSPKSVNLTWPCASNSIFSGFKSLQKYWNF